MTLDTVLPLLNVGARVVVVGTAATGAWLPPPMGPRVERNILVKVGLMGTTTRVAPMRITLRDSTSVAPMSVHPASSGVTDLHLEDMHIDVSPCIPTPRCPISPYPAPAPALILPTAACLPPRIPRL